MPLRFVPGGGVCERLVELMPQVLVFADIVEFCHLTDPIICKVKVGSVVLTESGQLEQSFGEGEWHRLVAIDQIIGTGWGHQRPLV